MLKRHAACLSRNIVFFLMAIMVIYPSLASAQTSVYQQLETPFYEPGSSTNSTSCSTTSSATTAPTGTESSGTTWNSGVQPPYYLEEFAINVLEDLAQTANVPQADTLSQEHVVALVSWFSLEGGNTANTDSFNPLNSNELVPGSTTQSTGDQAYPSFDSGVQATVLTMLGSNQNRVATTLEDSSTTAEDFMQAETYWQNYPGNKAWAQADPAPGQTFTDSQGTVWTQAKYLDSLMSSLQSTRANYALVATTELGSGMSGNNPNVPSSDLKYSGGTSNPTTGGPGTGDCQITSGSSDCTANGTVATTSGDAIACQALKYDTLSYSESWHSSGSVFHKNCDSAYKTSGQTPPAEVNGEAVGPQCDTDCSGLVNIVIYDLFNNDVNDTTYTEVADTANFKEINFSQVQPGDFIQPNPDHVEIIEQVSGSTINTFAAHTDQVPQPDQVGPAQYTDTPGYVYLRYIGNGYTPGGYPS
jgi:hypothetical protein